MNNSFFSKMGFRRTVAMDENICVFPVLAVILFNCNTLPFIVRVNKLLFWLFKFQILFSFFFDK